ncbi:MAG: amino acid ABC transporter permease [Lachnospiraceae bacterium]|nr:amino acid ABC transporter permease [Lachnospiraceae bacterium]MBR5944057.1 amino acid ABC transporter permease [Lachnospiraceae bacterium]
MGKVFDIEYMLSTVPEILKYLPVTLKIALYSGIISLILGFAVALVRTFKIKVLSQICAVYVSFIRGTPAMVQLLVAYYGIPIMLKGMNESLGTNLNVSGIPASVFAVVALSLNTGAFMSETIRSAILAVDAGQLEACYSVNMNTFTALRRIILPQAFTVALPPLGNSLISLLKETSLIFNISVIEMMAAAKIVGTRSFRFFEVYIVVALIYWACCLVLERLLLLLEKRVRKYERSAVK